MRYRIPPRTRVISGSSEYVAVLVLSRANVANAANAAEPFWDRYREALIGDRIQRCDMNPQSL